MTTQTPTSRRAHDLFLESQDALHRSTDKLFGYLMVCQYAGAVIWALLNTPQTWVGQYSYIHPHVWTALLLGGLIALPTAALTYYKPGAAVTRWTVSVCQMLMSALLIHVSGGRIETHFHVFGSLAFLAFYRDWRLLVPATLVVLVDHIVRGIYNPASVYGVSSGAEWRFVEHAAWVVFENIILIAACLRGVREMRIIADRQALLESTYSEVETLVQKRTEELQRSQERKSAILHNAFDAIVSMDSNGRITEFNPAAEAMFLRNKDEVAGHGFAELLIPEELREAHAQGMQGFLDTGQSQLLNHRIELTAMRSNGERFPVEGSITPVHLGDDIIFTAFIRDIGERKRLETDLAHAQKMESIGQLAAGVAHEINTPNQYIGDNIRFLEESFSSVTTAIGAYQELHLAVKAEGVQRELVTKVDEVAIRTDLEFVLEEFPRAVEQALDGVERVASIVRAMKEFSHPGQESHTMVDINRVIDSTVTVARNEWKYVAQVELALDPSLPNIEGHPGALGQVFLNLIINSVHAIKERFGSEASGQIRIATSRSGDSVEITLSDNGCGIPDHAQSRIFEPFYTTKDVGLGTGQGLAISRTVITEKHGGQIDYATALNEGTTFTIRLPIEAAKDEAA